MKIQKNMNLIENLFLKGPLLSTFLSENNNPHRHFRS